MVGTGKLADLAVTMPKLAPDSVNSGHIQPSSIFESDIADNAISAPKIQNNAVFGNKIADFAIVSTKLFSGAVTEPKIAGGAVTVGKLADEVVTHAKVSADASPRWAVVSAAGNLVRSRGATGSQKVISPGGYAVTFDRDVSGCSMIVQIGGSASTNFPPSGMATHRRMSG